MDFETNFKILEVCNPVQAKEALNKNIEVGYFLPCKLVVYEKNSSAYVGMIKPTRLMHMLNSEELLSIAREAEDELKKAIDGAL